ncbi:hypothetical protein PR202_ga08574 [Eleusine coracana subsp. coracana]|uniref:Cathepsin propeptide inhibitor domain-containing protein n=1 Tax=Eleusine coracana subsp. coracana TaxID=191504 RepID=A0AAV5C2M2_ELECO|nr:hypothetical protein PR202_ga08573 [Eleusine coracana subsp. coracana]GJM92140.1 hypothetical protein PR202_ga08574 [Eleusine coracana subsp. coracana]
MASRQLLLAALVVSSLAAVELCRAIPFNESDLASEQALWNLYERWRVHHKVHRHHSEKRHRFGIFKDNVHFIHRHNKHGRHPYRLRLNHFGDIDHKEFRSTFASSRINDLRREEPRAPAVPGFMYDGLVAGGYIRMQRGVGDGGLCGIAMEASFPVKTSPNPVPKPRRALISRDSSSHSQ